MNGLDRCSILVENQIVIPRDWYVLIGMMFKACANTIDFLNDTTYPCNIQSALVVNFKQSP